MPNANRDRNRMPGLCDVGRNREDLIEPDDILRRWRQCAKTSDELAVGKDLIAGQQTRNANCQPLRMHGSDDLEPVPGEAAVAMEALFAPRLIGAQQRPRRVVE